MGSLVFPQSARAFSILEPDRFVELLEVGESAFCGHQFDRHRTVEQQVVSALSAAFSHDLNRGQAVRGFEDPVDVCHAQTEFTGDFPGADFPGQSGVQKRIDLLRNCKGSAFHGVAGRPGFHDIPKQRPKGNIRVERIFCPDALDVLQSVLQFVHG